MKCLQEKLILMINTTTYNIPVKFFSVYLGKPLMDPEEIDVELPSKRALFDKKINF